LEQDVLHHGCVLKETEPRVLDVAAEEIKNPRTRF
jgi:hypothetical protein